MKKYIYKILIIGLVLRLFLAFSTYHSDIVPFDFAGRVLTETKITNFYDFLWQIPDDHPYLSVYPRNLFNYPPLPYFFVGGFSLLTTWIVNPVVHSNFLTNFTSTLGNPQLNLLLFLLKFPYFFFDIAVAFLLMKLFKKETNKKLAFAFWMFNPITLFATFMMGQFDVIPVFFVVLSLVLAPYNLPFSAVMLGLGGGFKIFPMLLLAPLVLVKNSWRDRIEILFAGVGTYVLTAYPFIFSQGFRKTAFLAGQTTKSFYAQIPISGGESIILFLAAVIFFYILFYFKKSDVNNLWKRYFVMLLVFFIFTHYHPQWFLWLTPFLIIDLVKSKLKHLPLYLGVFAVYLLQISFFDPGLSIWLFAPINQSLYGLPGVWETLGVNLGINLARSVLQSILVGIFGYLIYEKVN